MPPPKKLHLSIDRVRLSTRPPSRRHPRHLCDPISLTRLFSNGTSELTSVPDHKNFLQIAFGKDKRGEDLLSHSHALEGLICDLPCSLCLLLLSRISTLRFELVVVTDCLLIWVGSLAILEDNRIVAEMDPEAFKSRMSNLNFGNVMAAAARDYQKEMLVQGKAQTSTSTNEEVDLDELMDDPELEKLHAERIAALKRESEKRQALQRKGHGEYRDISEGDFLGEVTGTEKAICHFYHREFYRCKIMDKHLKSLAPRHLETKFIKLDAENAPFFVNKLGVKTLPCVILFRKGIAIDRVVGFQDLGAKDDFTTTKLENLLIKKGIIDVKKNDEDDEDERNNGDNSKGRSVRSSLNHDSDSD